MNIPEEFYKSKNGRVVAHTVKDLREQLDRLPCDLKLYKRPATRIELIVYNIGMESEHFAIEEMHD